MFLPVLWPLKKQGKTIVGVEKWDWKQSLFSSENGQGQSTY